MSLYTAEKLLQDNLKLFGTPAGKDPEKHNLYAALVNITKTLSNMETRISNIEKDIRNIQIRLS